MSRRAIAFIGSLGLCASVLVGCSGRGDPPDSGAPATFIAFSSSFQGFRTWQSFHSDGPEAGTVTPDVLGPRTQYINHLPPHGSKTFPVGTIIVEARESGLMNIFAAVKRGGDFNITGARDWEWFELKEAPDATVTIVWHGFGPPKNGDVYGGDPNGGCNACHAAYASNDYVASPYLQLSNF